jgi:hypothetical protein
VRGASGDLPSGRRVTEVAHKGGQRFLTATGRPFRPYLSGSISGCSPSPHGLGKVPDNDFEPLHRLRKSLPCIAIVTGNHARLFGFFLQLLDDIGVADLAIRAVVPRDGGGLEPLRSTHSSGVSPSTSTSWVCR